MEVSILQEKLHQGLTATLKVISSKPTLPVLSNVFIEAKEGRMELASTDLSMGIRVWLGAKVKNEGKITVPAKLLSDLVSSFSPSSITLKVDGESLRVTGTGHSSRISGIDASEFPTLGILKDSKHFSLLSQSFSEAIERVTLSASTDETRPVLSGVLFIFKDNRLSMVATDGYRLSLVAIKKPTVENEEKWNTSVKSIIKEGVILPARALREVEKLAGEEKVKEIRVSLASDQNLAVFHVGDAELTTRLIDGTFPNYGQVIPKEIKSTAILDIEPLIKAVRTASIFARDSANIIHWKFGQGKLTVSANAPSYGESENILDIELVGDGGEIAFNSRYLIDYLSVVKEKRVQFQMNGSLDPGVFVFEGKKRDDFLHLIMPVRVQK